MKDSLRKRAEKAAMSIAENNIALPTLGEARAQLHELRVHQIELEMQNEELRRAQVELDNSRARFFELYDLAPSGYCTLSEKGIIQEANLTSAAMLGVARSDLIRQLFSPHILSEDQDIFYKHRRALFATGDAQECDLRMLRHDGTQCWIHLAMVFATDEFGAPICRVALSDLTSSKQSEQEVRRSEARMQSLVRILQHPFTSAQSFLDFTLNECLAIMESKIGFICKYDESSRQVVLFSWSKSVMQACRLAEPHKSLALDTMGVWGEALRKRRPVIINDFQAANPLKRGYPEGHAHVRSFMSIPVFKNDAIVAVVGMGNKETSYTDVDVRQLSVLTDAAWKVLERQQTKRALHESEERYRLLFEQSLDAIAIEEGYPLEFRWVNPAFCELTGYAVEELYALSPLGIMGMVFPEDQELVRQLHLQMHSGRLEEMRQAFRMLRKDGALRWVNVSSKRTEYDGNSIYLSIYRDITKERHINDLLVQAKDHAESASRSKSEFLANMSHEIRTPLNGILGMLQLLEISAPTNEQHEYIVSAIDSSKRLTRLLADILDLSRVEAGKMQVVNKLFSVTALKEAITELFRHAVKPKGLDLVFDIDAKVPDELFGDDIRLRQILFNLVGNAIKFTDSGTVRVTVTLLRIHAESQAEMLFSVRDTGIGIPENRLADIFEPFIQTEGAYTRSYQGAGLGLAIVSRLVKLMNGEIDIDSVVGEGTTVSVTLPFMLPGETEQPPIRNSCSMLPRLRILFAEDDKVNQLASTRLLEKAGHTVTCAQNGQEVMALLTEADFDLILMDIQMPVMDGVEATKAIRKSASLGAKSRIPILAMTAYDMVGDKEIFLAAGMNGYIAKPVEVEKIIQAISQVIH